MKREALRAGGTFSDETESLTTFVREMSGGLADRCFLFELRDFIRSCQNDRTVRGPILEAVAMFRPKGFGAETASHCRLALCKAMLSCNDKDTEGERQRLLKSTEITSLRKDDKKMALLKESDSFLQDCNAFIDRVYRRKKFASNKRGQGEEEDHFRGLTGEQRDQKKGRQDQNPGRRLDFPIAEGRHRIGKQQKQTAKTANREK